MKILLTVLLFMLVGCSPKQWFKTLGERMCPCSGVMGQDSTLIFQGTTDTSKCFIMIVNPKNGKYNYHNAYEVAKFIDSTQDWEHIKYLYEDRKTVIRETKRRCVIYIESQM